MNILVVNRGSSTIKCFLYQFTDFSHEDIKPFWEAELEWKNAFEEAHLSVKNGKGLEHEEAIREKDPKKALKYLVSFLFQGKVAVLKALNEIDVIGHRIVHGGKYFHSSVHITEEVKEKIRLLAPLAPLHNLPELEAVEILETLLPNIPQIAVFDTAFHHTLPKAAQIYPIPYKWVEEGIRRYGFHGISFQYCAKRGAVMLNAAPDDLKMVICHLGSGASLCAIQNGKSIDTTMGFTPLDGLMMDTRSGSIDPGIILYLLENKKKSVQEISHELYEESGLLGISGNSGDMRDIIKKHLEGDLRATMALDIYIHTLNGFIAKMIASLKGIDLLIFTAGIGENTPLIRERVCETFSFLNMELDKTKNSQNSLEDREISTPDSKVKILVIHTKEAFEIASACWKEAQSSC